MKFEDLPLYKRFWIRLRDMDGTWGFFFSFYQRDRKVIALHLDRKRQAIAWRVPEGGRYTWMRGR